MFRTTTKALLIFTICLMTAIFTFAQADASDALPGRNRGDRDFPMGMKEMLTKQRIARDRKQFREMQERGEEALRLSKYLETSFEQNKTLSQQDRDRLVDLENIVEKIRDDLGGDDADEKELQAEKKPGTLEEAFKSLQQTTVSLVDELKKTTRFTISAVAIQTSNSALRIIRFLRLKK